MPTPEFHGLGSGLLFAVPPYTIPQNTHTHSSSASQGSEKASVTQVFTHMLRRVQWNLLSAKTSPPIIGTDTALSDKAVQVLSCKLWCQGSDGTKKRKKNVKNVDFSESIESTALRLKSLQ